MAERKKQTDLYIDLERFKLGLYALDDTTKAPFGSAKTMRNVYITDRGGIAPRPGTQLLGTENTTNSGIRGLYNFRKSFDEDEFLIKVYDDEMEVYSKNHPTAGWWRLKNGFTTGKEFGFVTSLVNTSNEDYVIFNNRYEPYQRWNGAVMTLAAALSGGESVLTVDSVLTDEIFYSGSVDSATATTIDIANSDWAADMWNGLYVYITSGTYADQIRLITDGTATQITFDALAGAPSASDTFEVRKFKLPTSGTVIYNGTTIAYSSVVKYNEIPVSSAHAASSGAVVSLVPDEYPALPRGNRLTNYLGRIIVGRVRSALARGTGGALQGFSSGGSYFVSEISDPFSFDFSATRVAGEGDIIGTPYGGGEIEDVQHHEDTAYIFKQRYIEAAKYSQDANDLIVREPLKAEVGSLGRVIKGSDDIYFFTPDNKFTSIGRVARKDLKPSTENIGYPIQRLLNDFVGGQGRGKEHVDRIYIPFKENSNKTNNNIVLVYNKINSSYEGIWDIPAYELEDFDSGKLYYAESNGANVYQMLTGTADVVGTQRFPIVAQYQTHFMNLTPSKANLQALNTLYFEGYISGDSKITFKAWKGLSADPFLTFDFSAQDDVSLLDGTVLQAFLGNGPMGLSPMGTIGEPDLDGRRHFQFRVYFPWQYSNYFSVGFASSGTDYNYEVTRIGLGVRESFSLDNTKVKNL